MNQLLAGGLETGTVLSVTRVTGSLTTPYHGVGRWMISAIFVRRLEG